MTDGGVHRGEEIGESRKQQHLLLPRDCEDRAVGVTGIEHDRGGGELTDSIRQLAAEDELGAQPRHGIIEVSRIHEEDRETGAQTWQLAAEQVAVEEGLIGH